MSKEYKLEFNDNYIVVEEPYEKDKGVVVLSKTDDCSLHILYKSYNPTHIDFFIKLIKYVADLETKLAEHEAIKNKYKTIFLDRFVDAKVEDARIWKEKYDQLKEQLAEKDSQIEQLKKFDDLNKTFFDLFRTAFKEPNKVDDLFNTLKTMQEKQAQDKISFAVEQLRLLKSQIERRRVYKDKFGEFVNGIKNALYDVEDDINNLIKQLKDGK